jgi:hypothetical protein
MVPRRSSGTVRPIDPTSCLAVATDRAVAKLVEEFAVVRKEIKVKRDAFRIATEYYDGEWQKARKLSPAATKAFVVVEFPPDCDRNSFAIRIVRKDRREVLFEQAFRWERRWSFSGRGRAFEFSPSDIAARGGGVGQYVAKLYSGAKPVLDADFQIVPGA